MDLLHTLLTVRFNYVSLKDCQACMNQGFPSVQRQLMERQGFPNILLETVYCIYLCKE